MTFVLELRDRIQKVSSVQLQAIQYALYMGMTPKAAKECEYRQEQISRLVDKLAALHKEPRMGPEAEWLEIF